MKCRCRSASCRDSLMVTLPAGKRGVYHYDFRTRGHRIEVKSGVGYNLDTLFRIAEAAENWPEFVVFCDSSFLTAWKRYAKEVPRLTGVRVKFALLERG